MGNPLESPTRWKPSGISVTASPWLIRTTCSLGVPAKSSDWARRRSVDWPYSRLPVVQQEQLLPPSLVGQQLHSVTDTKNWNTKFKKFLRQYQMHLRHKQS